MEEKEVILTQEGYDKIEKELEFLRTEKRTDKDTKEKGYKIRRLNKEKASIASIVWKQWTFF